MKKLIWIMVLGTLAVTSTAEAASLEVLSFADTSCGTWTKTRTNPAQLNVYLYWIRGFISGFNYGRPSTQVRAAVVPNQATLAIYVDKYCADYPLRPFIGAAFSLVDELKEQPEEKAQP